MIQAARVAGLGHLSRGPDSGQAAAREVDGRPRGWEAGVGRLKYFQNMKYFHYNRYRVLHSKSRTVPCSCYNIHANNFMS